MINQEENQFFKKVLNNLGDLQEFITHERAVGKSRHFWAEFDNSIDVQFDECDDTDCPDFGKLEFFAYPIKKTGDQEYTDTSYGLQIKDGKLVFFTELINFSIIRFTEVNRWFYELGKVRGKMRYDSPELAFQAMINKHQTAQIQSENNLNNQ